MKDERNSETCSKFRTLPFSHLPFCPKLLPPSRSATAPPVDVAIVGGGLGGLAAAHAIRRANPALTVRVYERSTAFGPAGGAVGINPNATKVLRAIDPDLEAHVHSKLTRTPTRSILKTTKGQILDRSEHVVGTVYLEKKYNVGMNLGPWGTTQMSLMERLPEGTVVPGRAFSSLEVLEDGGGGKVRASFQVVGADATETVECRVLIGADGLNSKVRDVSLAALGAPSLKNGEFADSGLVFFRAQGSAKALREAGHLPESLELEANTTVTLIGGSEGIGMFWRGAAESEDELTVMVMAPYPLVEQKGFDISFKPGNRHPILTRKDPAAAASAAVSSDPSLPAAGPGSATSNASAWGWEEKSTRGRKVRDDLLSIVSAWPEDVKTLLAGLEPSRLLQHGVHFRLFDTLPTEWGVGPVTLLGDAFHPAGPAGQGFGLAVEDAYQLAKSIQAHGPTEAALRDYEKARAERIATICGLAYEIFSKDIVRPDRVQQVQQALERAAQVAEEAAAAAGPETERDGAEVAEESESEEMRLLRVAYEARLSPASIQLNKVAYGAEFAPLI